MKRLERIFTKFNLKFFNTIIIFIGFLIFSFGLLFTKNYIVLFIDLLLLFMFSYNYKTNKYIISVLNFIILFFLVSLLISFLTIPVYSIEIKDTFMIILKFLLFIFYLFLIIFILKEKDMQIIENKYTLNQLRRDNIYHFKTKKKKEFNKYILKNEISKDSSQYEILENNLLPTIKNELENYVRVEYLRFYKNKSIKRILNFSEEEFLFLIIHVIILILSIIVR